MDVKGSSASSAWPGATGGSRILLYGVVNWGTMLAFTLD